MTRSKVPAFIRWNERLIAWSYRRHGLQRTAVQIDPHTRVACWVPCHLRALVKSGHFDDPDATHPDAKRPPAEQPPADAYAAAAPNSSSSENSNNNTVNSSSASATIAAAEAGGKRLKPPVLLLHGFGGSAIWQWVQQVPVLSKHFDLYMPDLVFFGGSSSSSDERSDVFQAESMVRLLDRLGLASCHVIGLSYGGIVAYRMAALHPERVSRLVLVGSGVMATKADYDDMLTRWKVSHASEVFLPQDPPAVQRLLSIAHYHPPKLPQWLLKSLVHVMLENEEEKRQMLDALLSQLDNPPDPYPTPTMESLLVWGDSDDVFPSSIAEKMHRHFGEKSQLVVVEKAAHALNAHCPKKFNHVVLDFLKPK